MEGGLKFERLEKMRFQMNRMTTLRVYRIVTITPNEEMQKKKITS